MAEFFHLYPPHPIGCFPNQRCQRGWGGGVLATARSVFELFRPAG